jgi:hypothetical protein
MEEYIIRNYINNLKKICFVDPKNNYIQKKHLKKSVSQKRKIKKKKKHGKNIKKK